LLLQSAQNSLEHYRSVNGPSGHYDEQATQRLALVAIIIQREGEEIYVAIKSFAETGSTN
jgi:hypothetical protein